MKQRVVVPELMDDPGIPAADHASALAGLARLNRWSWGDAGLWEVLSREASQVAPRKLRVLDLATGSADLPIRLAQRAARRKIAMHLAGCDISPTALEIATKNAARNGVTIDLFSHDVVSRPIPSGYDVLITSLFLHHLTDGDAVRLLRRMAEATARTVVVNDLCRGRFNLGLVKIASRILSRSYVVHHDGPASVRAAFTIAEAGELARQAGLTDAVIVPKFPCRWLLTWRKPA